MNVIKTDLGGLGKVLQKQADDLRKQTRFAAMKAINDVSFMSRTKIIDAYKKNFHTRNRTFPETVKVEKATKERLFARIFFPHDFFVLNETGGEKRAKQKSMLAVPLSKSSGKNWSSGDITRSSKGSVQKSMRPGSLLKYYNAHNQGGRGTAKSVPHAFIIKSSKGTFIARRDKDDRARMEFFYILKNMGDVPARWNFVNIVKKTSGENLKRIFEERLQWALDHPKPSK